MADEFTNNQSSEDAGIFSSFVLDSDNSNKETEDAGIFSSFISDEEDYTPKPLIKDYQYYNDSSSGMSKEDELRESIKLEKFIKGSSDESKDLDESDIIINGDTGNYEVNDRFAIDNKDLLPYLNLKAETYNTANKLRQEYLAKVEEDPLNVDSYTEEYTDKLGEYFSKASLDLSNSLNPDKTTGEYNEGGFLNAVTQGINHSLYNSANQGDFLKTFSTSMWEKTSDILPFSEPNVENIHFPTLFQPTGINTELESDVESISRSLTDMATTMLGTATGTAVGAGAGSIAPGLGTAAGAGIGAATGTITASGMIANAMYAESLSENFNKYLEEGLERNDAAMRAVTDAVVDGSIEFGSGILGAGIAKLLKAGVPLSRVLKAAGNLVKNGGIRKTEAGLEITKAGAKAMQKDIKSMLKSAGIVMGKSFAVEGGEELAQGVYSTIRHREEGQTWAEALGKNAKSLARQTLVGGVGGVLSIGSARAVTKGFEFGGEVIANKLDDIAEKKAVQQEETKAALEAVVAEDLENLNKTSTPGEVTPIGNDYGTDIEGNQEVTPQGETVLTDKVSDTEIKTDSFNESVDEELAIQDNNNNNNNNNEAIYTEPEETISQKNKLNETRNDIAIVTDIDNNELENTIPGSVSDNGYTSSDSYPIEGTGLARKDEVPTTPETAKNNIAVHHDETIKAMNALGIKEANKAPATQQAPATPQTSATQQAPATPTVSNENVSSIHKYYGIKNFVESVGSAVTDRLGKPYKLFVKGELSNKEKRLRHLGRTVRAYVRPMVDNVIRISNSRDYPALIHETVHHLVAKMQLLQNELANTNTRKLLRREHRRLENIDPTYRLNEAGYRQRGQDIYEEYFSNIVAAYGTGTFVPNTAIVDLINQGMEQVGVTDQFNTMRQQFLDYSNILEQPNGALKIAENNMKAIGLLQQGKFDTTNLTAKQLSTFKKLINYSASLPRRFIETWLNENYQIEKDAVRTDNFNEILKADQALQLNNRIANAFITGTGVYFNNGNLHKLERSKAIKSLAKIYAETKALGEGYDKTLESLLWAKQTIGESTGTQAKANALLTLTKDLGYSSWENARTDLKLLSLLAQANLYQGMELTSVDLNNIRREAQTIINRDGGVPLTSLPSERESVLTDLRRVNFNDPNLLTRLNAVINYVQARAITHAMNNPSPGATQTSIKNDYIRDTYILDRQGEVNTGMSLSEALRIYTSLQSNPKIQQLESLETDVRTLFNSLENLMSASSTASRLRIALAKNSTGAWYIPLLRFIDPNEEKAIGIATLGNSFKPREGSSREVLGIFTSIENSIKAVANTVTKDQAIDYLLRLRDTPIFAQYMREVPADSVEVKVNLLYVVNNKIKEVEQQLYALLARGELPPNLNPALPMPNNIQDMNYYQYLRNIKENIERDIYSGNLSTEEIMASIWIDTQPSNKNIIQRLEDDGRLHYYLINDTLKNFIYNQRKSIGNIQLSNQYIKDSLNLIAKVNNILQTIARTSYTVASIPFQLANIPRDTLDVAIKGDENNTFTSGYLGLIPRYITQLYNYFKVAGGLLSAKNREEFNTLTTLFGGAEQTQYREGEYTTTYLNYKLNKKGKIVRGGMVGWLETLIDIGGMSDLITRVAVLKNRCRQLGLDIHDINATYDDYLSLELPKNLLERYITDSDIETIFGRDKADAWRATKDTEYIPFVPEEFEKRQLNNILSSHQNEIDSRVNPDLRAELQELYNRSSIDFSKGTALTRSLGKVFMFFNTRTQGGYQYLRYANSHTRSFSGSISALLTLGILGTLLGWEDDDPEDKEKRVLKGLHIEDDSLGINVILPTQSFPLIPHRIGVSIGRLIKNIKEYNNINKSGASEDFKEKLYNERLDKTIGKDLITELTGIAWDNSLGSFNTPSGLAGALLGSLSFLPFGELPNYGDEKKYHEFSYYAKKKAGINVDTLTKKSDTWLSRKLSEWLVDNGIYKYSAHEIDRYLKLYFGNAVSQVEGMLGLKTILDDKDNNINWFKYTSDQVDALISSMTKPFTVPLFVQNYSSKEIDRLEFESLSKYDRLTGQTGTTARNRVKPEYLSDEDKLKFQKLYDIHYLARRAQSNLKGIYSIIDKIDRNASGGEKAYKEAVQIYRDYADYAKDMLDSYDPFEEGAVPYQKIYPLLDEKKNVSIGKVNAVVKNSAKKAEEGGFRDSLIGKGIDAILKATTSEAKAEDTIDINTDIRNNLETAYKNFYEDRKNPDLKNLLSYANVREELNKKAHEEAFSENNKASDKAESDYNSVVQFDISHTDNGNPDIPYKSTAKIEVSDRRINDKDWVNIQQDGSVTVGPYQANSRSELKEFFNSGNLETFVEKKDVPQLIEYPKTEAHLFPAKPKMPLEPLTNKGKRVSNFKVTPYYKYMLDDNNNFINLESEEGIKRLKTLSKDKTFINELVNFHDNKFETAFTKSELPSGKNNIIKNFAHSVFTYTGNLTGIKPGKTAAETIKKSLIYLKKNNTTYRGDTRRLAKEAFAFYRTALGKGTLEKNLNLFDTYDETRHSSIKNKNNKFKSINDIFGYLDKENTK
jgi:hypothetical protein